MCGVVGYIGKNLSKEFILEGLARLEYRGYDSAGFACIDSAEKKLVCIKAIGCLNNLSSSLVANPINGFLGVGHTRWATHGQQTIENTHPLFDCTQAIAVVHNGIIENHHVLRQQLREKNHRFSSQTDTEVIAHLFEALLAQHTNIYHATLSLVSVLEGAYSCFIIMQNHPDLMIVMRKQSPLCIGIGENEMFIASDALAFADKTERVLFLPDETFAVVKSTEIALYRFNGEQLPITQEAVTCTFSATNKNEYAHHMLKEIYEQKKSIGASINFLESISKPSLWDYLNLSTSFITSLERIKIVGCGTSWHAGRIAQFFFETIAKIPVHVYLASEFRYMPFFPEQKCLYLALSQSGETADTLEAMRVINAQQLPIVALTNVASSTMVREAQGCLLTQAGPEIAVASTKAFSTQLATLYWFAHHIALAKAIITHTQMQQAIDNLFMVAQILEDTIEKYKQDIITTYAKKYASFERIIFLGRHISYPFALESALKLKEVAYIFSQCYPAGELKHGPLALIDENTPLFVFSVCDSLLYKKLVSNVHEAKARNGHIVSFAFEGQDELCELSDLCFVIPQVPSLLGPLAMTGLMQFFVYAIANELGLPIDQPRNLAKSVTVE